MRKIIISLAIIIWFGGHSIYSQSPPYYHYTPSNGLAASTVYDIIQDRKGFIWFATLNGLNRFDGKRFITYKIIDGLNSNSITSLLEGEEGELYIGNFENGINVFRNGKIENFRTTIKGKNFKTSYLIDTEKNIYSYSSYSSISEIAKRGNGEVEDTVINPRISPRNPNLYRIIKTPEDQMLLLTSGGLYSLKNRALEKLNVAGLNDENLYSAVLDKDGSIIIGGESIIYRIKNDKVISSLPIKLFNENNVYYIFIDSQSNIWFSIQGKGFYVIPNGTENIINMGVKMGLENAQVNKFYEDNEKNIWIGTFGKGVYCLTNLYLKNYSEKEGLINNNVNSIIKDSSGKLIIGTINGISVMEDGILKPLKYNSGEVITGYVNNLIKKNNYIYVSLTSLEPKAKEVFSNNIKFRLSRLQSICEIANGLFILGSVGNNITIQRDFNYRKDSEQTYVFGDSSYQNRINFITEDSKNNIWIGTTSGLCKISNWVGKETAKWDKTFFKDDLVLSSKITSIHEDNDNKVWFAAANGVASYDLRNNSVTSYSTILGHDISASNSIVSDKKGRIWIGNLKGVYMFDGKTMKHLNSQSGLPSNEVLSLYFDEPNDQLFIGTSNGFSELDINYFDNYKTEPPIIRINKIVAGDSVFANYVNLEFERDQNNVFIDISAINYSSPSTIRYKYKLNNNWTETDNNIINYSSLEHGKYNLEIYARTQNSDWSKPSIVSFRVLPRFYETVWFYLFLLVILISLHILFIFWRIKLHKKKIREELELTERINELKHQALSAMMNPHFIFNSLNSVQYLINSQRNEEANDYIAVMAKLIRKNLDTAGSGFILLAEEINRLKLYLDLEQLRFQDNFSYEIITGPNVDINSILIPNMIIQPFVENSLWHGIINSGMKGLLSVSFYFEEVEIDSVIYKSLIIRVTDNGIGINEAKKNKKEDHISRGIQIIEERLRLISTKMEIPKPIMIEDLSNTNGNSHGTEIIISLPPPLYKLNS
jgi:ligand-binding sensor domain-containing protein/two-component sensor histidine kinase